MATSLDLEAAFQLTSEDKKQRPPMLSVWSRRLATPTQALCHLALTGARQVLSMQVDDVLAIVDDMTQSADLTVVWDHHEHLDRALPGWCAHAGIVGMDNGSRTRRKVVRLALCDLVNRRAPFPLVQG